MRPERTPTWRPTSPSTSTSTSASASRSSARRTSSEFQTGSCSGEQTRGTDREVSGGFSKAYAATDRKEPGDGDSNGGGHGRSAGLAGEEAGAAQPPLRLDDLERLPLPRRRRRGGHLRQVRHHLDPADRRPAAAPPRPRPRGGRAGPLARPARPPEGGEAADGGGADAPALPENPPPPGRPQTGRGACRE